MTEQNYGFYVSKDDNPLAEGERDKGVRLVTFREEFEKVFKEARNAQDLADLMKVGTSNIYRYRDGVQQPSWRTCQAIAEACKVMATRKDAKIPTEWLQAYTWRTLARQGEMTKNGKKL